MKLSPASFRDLLLGLPADQCTPELVAYLANLSLVASTEPLVAERILGELEDQRSNLKLIASENYCSPAVQAALGNLLTDKYAEGVPSRRFYAGCDNVDAIEQQAASLATRLFGADHAYVQPHSGADANLVAFWAILSARVEVPALRALGALTERGLIDATKLSELPESEWETVRQTLGNQRLLAMDFRCGGHLTHGYRMNVSAKMFRASSYAVDPQTQMIDYDLLMAQAREVKPLILLAGYSAYPRKIDFERLRAIADSVGAVLMVDMAHFAGLVAGGVFRDQYNPIPYADVVSSTTHKTLRGPRGGLVLCRSEFAEFVDRGCPLILGGPLPHVVAAKAVCFAEALSDSFRTYARQVVDNAAALASALTAGGVPLVSGGTDNHLVLADVRGLGLTGRQAEDALRSCGVTLNRNVIPNDTNSPLVTSGLRLGTAAVTTLGMGVAEMQEIAGVVVKVLRATKPGTGADGRVSKIQYDTPDDVRAESRRHVRRLLEAYPLYPRLKTDVLRESLTASAAASRG